MARATIGQARAQQRVASMTERLLWKLLRDRQVSGLKFRRQVPLGAYVVDFLCLEVRLVVEADGPFHDPERDAIRDAWLDTQGFKVRRFTNHEIQRDPARVLDQIPIAAGRAAPFREV